MPHARIALSGVHGSVNRALAAEGCWAARPRCGILGPGAFFEVPGGGSGAWRRLKIELSRGNGVLCEVHRRSGARVVHDAKCTGAPVREWCTVRSARALRCEWCTVRSAPALLCESGAQCGVHGRSGARRGVHRRSGARVVHGAKCTGAPVRDWCTVRSARALQWECGAQCGVHRRSGA